MSFRSFSSALSLWLGKAAELLRAFGQWWLRELLALFPVGVSQWLVDDGSRVLVLVPGEGMVSLHLTNARRRLLASEEIGEQEYSADAIDGFLKAHGLSRNRVTLGVRLAPGSFFSRNLVLPLETRRSLDAVVLQDLLNKTPFQADDIYHAHVAPRVGDKIEVSQWVVRRSRVNDLVEALRLDPDTVAFVESHQSDLSGDIQPSVALRPTATGAGRWIQRAFVALAAIAVSMAILAAYLRFQSQQVVLDRLEVEVAAATTKAREVRAALDKLGQDQASLVRLRSRKGDEPGFLDIWEETTRILPKHSWLTELRMSETPEGRQIVISGLSMAAASLVGLIQQSDLFSDASLIAPISVDTVEERERFAIQATIKKQTKSRTASR